VSTPGSTTEGPQPAYQAAAGGALTVDRELYGRLSSEGGAHTLVDEFVIPIRSGRAWTVRAGQLCRIVVVEGPQVGDLNLWHLHNPRERFWAARTRQLHRAHVSTYDRLWSTLPYLRPMATITRDTVSYGVDADGGAVTTCLALAATHTSTSFSPARNLTSTATPTSHGRCWRTD
jgi:uncharacterized protein YcgI (DUF1989 family)